MQCPKLYPAWCPTTIIDGDQGRLSILQTKAMQSFTFIARLVVVCFFTYIL